MADIPAAKPADAAQVSFRVFANGLDPAMGEALRAYMQILPRDVDKSYSQDRLQRGLAELTGKE